MSSLHEQVNGLIWFHSIDLGDGIISPGVKSLDVLTAEANVYFPFPLAGKTVLDIGCWDGANSFAAARRGAARVLATDHHVWANGIGKRQAFDIARQCVAPSVEVLDADLADLTPERVGRFDVVLFTGVLYHLRNPLIGLEHAARLTTGELIVETHLDALDYSRPAMVFYPGAELNGDASNWWGPNVACVQAMLRDVGFKTIAYVPHPVEKSRGIFRATGLCP